MNSGYCIAVQLLLKLDFLKAIEYGVLPEGTEVKKWIMDTHNAFVRQMDNYFNDGRERFFCLRLFNYSTPMIEIFPLANYELMIRKGCGKESMVGYTGWNELKREQIFDFHIKAEASGKELSTINYNSIECVSLYWRKVIDSEINLHKDWGCI
jgi:hypothetical protein